MASTFLLWTAPGGFADSNPAEAPLVRWTEGKPGSSFITTKDGKYVYGLKDGELEINVSIDSQELEKVHHRPLPVLALQIDIHYSGQVPIDLVPGRIRLEFVRHDQVESNALDPDELSARIQNDIENLSDEVEHEVRKHPEKKMREEALLQAHMKDMTDLIGFVSVRCLRSATLDSGNPEVSGWLFFSTKSKWIGGWKLVEEFILHIPMRDRQFVFGFSLPPRKGLLILRRRDE